MLADDEDVDVRQVVAERTNDPDIIAHLADDPNGGIRALVTKRLTVTSLQN